MTLKHYSNFSSWAGDRTKAGNLFYSASTFLCSGVLYFSGLGSSVWGDTLEIRVFDGAGLFRAQGVIVQSVPKIPNKVTPVTPSDTDSFKTNVVSTSPTTGATVEVLVDRMPGDGLELSPLDSIGDPVTPQMVGERDGKLLFHFYGVQNGSWEIKVPSEALLEVRIMGEKGKR